jgi:oligoribonuclease NrnB/cAMP/cGMP phosphodiesterase (DHH superfamily)
MAAKKPLIIYHKNCQDGFGAAWVAWKKFGSKAEYFPAAHPSFPPKAVRGREVYMLDFCYSEEGMKYALKNASRVVVIDHHVSQREAVKFSTEKVFKMGNSGSVLSFKYFFPGKPVPKLLLHIEDKDIWKNSLKGSDEYLSYLETLDFDFKVWDKLIRDFEDAKKRKVFFEKGSSILSYREQDIKSLAASAEWVVFASRKCLAANSPFYVSEAGHILATKAKGVGIVWCKKGNKLKVSLRSNGKVDVAKIAAKYGGGGHKAAAAFAIEVKGPVVKLPWK